LDLINKLFEITFNKQSLWKLGGLIIKTFIPLTSAVYMYQTLTSSAGQIAWHLPDTPHIPVYLESAVGGTDDPNPTSEKITLYGKQFPSIQWYSSVF
jgi:hypothetical protein